MVNFSVSIVVSEHVNVSQVTTQSKFNCWKSNLKIKYRILVTTCKHLLIFFHCFIHHSYNDYFHASVYQWYYFHVTLNLLFHDEGRYHIETSPLICGAKYSRIVMLCYINLFAAFSKRVLKTEPETYFRNLVRSKLN